MDTIKSVKLKFSRIGINVPDRPRKVIYFPEITITYTNPEKKAIQKSIPELFGRFKNSDYLGYASCAEFLVLIFKSEWEIVSMEGKLLLSMPPCGQIIAVQDDYFIVKNDNTLTGYNKEGKNIGSRELTAEEIEELNKQV